MMREYSRIFSGASVGMPAIIEENPMMLLRGVRSSWLVVARNIDLTSLAASARWRSAPRQSPLST